MTIPNWVKIGAAVLVLAFVVLGGCAWLQEHDARLKAETKAEALQPAIDKANADSQAKDKSIANRDAAATQMQTAILQQSEQIKTLSQALTSIQKFQTANAPLGSKPGSTPAATEGVAVAKSDLTAAALAKLPDAPGYAIFTEAQVTGIAQSQLKCSADQVLLGKCQGDLADTTVKLADAKAATAATTKQRDDYKSALDGGTFWTRLGHAGKCLLLSGAGAGVGALADKAHPALGAAIGGGAGATACELLRW